MTIPELEILIQRIIDRQNRLEIGLVRETDDIRCTALTVKAQLDEKIDAAIAALDGVKQNVAESNILIQTIRTELRNGK